MGKTGRAKQENGARRRIGGLNARHVAFRGVSQKFMPDGRYGTISHRFPFLLSAFPRLPTSIFDGWRMEGYDEKI